MRLSSALFICVSIVWSLVLFSFGQGARSQSSIELDAIEAALVAKTPYRPPQVGRRYTAFISDLHFGVGRRRDGSWNPTEDFRWPKALEGFLTKISDEGQNNVDLVIVGDFFELWQRPREIACKGATADLGCTIDEMAALAQIVTDAHSDSLSVLRAFAEQGDNRVHIVPGNHDATIRYEPVWRPINEALRAESGRINLVTSGIWSSSDGRVVAEHGHQIGVDVNRYETWPRILRQKDTTNYVIRPWGEYFVQKLFNEQEEVYPIIDNLIPETAGARYRAADRGLFGSAADIARLLSFNLWETSPRQRTIMLGQTSDQTRGWNVDVGRQMGSDLFLAGLSVDDPMRREIAAKGPDWEAVNAELSALAIDPVRLPDEMVLHLCDLLADSGQKLCLDAQLGSAVQYALASKDKVLALHLRGRQRQFRGMQVFVYGHTHQYEEARDVQFTDLLDAIVINTGAFQRLIDEPSFLARLNGISAQEGLRTIPLEQLPPCYNAVIIPTQGGKPNMRSWRMHEDGMGAFVSPNSAGCK
jgi:UDP-2,3-diacylglucosamine pyrophosphatase LpxH